MPSENCVRCNIPLVRAVEKKLCCNCEDHGLSAEGWNHLQFASRECECQLCEQLASRFRIVAGPNDEPDFCVCDYRPRRKCSVHPESSNASQVEAIFQEVEKKLLSGELSETWPEIREWLCTRLRSAGSLVEVKTTTGMMVSLERWNELMDEILMWRARTLGALQVIYGFTGKNLNEIQQLIDECRQHELRPGIPIVIAEKDKDWLIPMAHAHSMTLGDFIRAEWVKHQATLADKEKP